MGQTDNSRTRADVHVPHFGEVDRSIGEAFAEQVTRRGNALAYTDDKTDLSYAELGRIVNAVAAGLCGAGSQAQKEGVVGILTDQGEAGIGSILGILVAGMSYLPLNASWPDARLSLIVEEAGTSVLLADANNFGRAYGLAPEGCRVLLYEEAKASPPAMPSRDSVGPYDQACVLYTSGSTGRPKRIPDNHRNILNNIRNYVETAGICQCDQLSLFHTHSFGASRLDIFGALLSGASLRLIDLGKYGFAEAARVLSESDISVYHSTPTVLRNLVSEAIHDTHFPKIRLVHLGSESVLRSDFELFRRTFHPDALFLNRYGTTETGTIAFLGPLRDLKSTGHLVPAGRPTTHLDVLAVAPDGSPVSCGEAGEVIVKGDYLGQGDQLCEASSPDVRVYRTGDIGKFDADGCLVVLGRLDTQVKIEGNRVDTREIVVALAGLPQVKSAAVRLSRTDTLEAHLVAYLVPMPHAALPSLDEVRAELSSVLPRYMIPSEIIGIPSLPVTDNGKLDTEKLSTMRHAPLRKSAQVVPERTVARLCELYAEVLGHGIDQDDGFFAQGGSSLRALRLLGRLRQEWNVEMDLSDVLRSPTPRELGSLIDSANACPSPSEGQTDTI